MHRCALHRIRETHLFLRRRRAVGGQDFAGEIERAGDEDARRRREGRACRRRRARFRHRRAPAPECRCRGDVGERRRRHRLVLMDRHGDDAAREAGKIAAGSPALSLVDSMPTISTSGRDTRSSRSASAAAMARPPSALWPPSSHSSLSGGSNAGSRPCDSRCMRAGQSTRVMPASKAAAGSFRPLRAQRRDRRAGILELMAAVKLRRRQIEQPVVVLINQPAALLGRGPVLAGDRQRRLHAAPPGARSPPARRAPGWRSPPARRA